MDTKNCKKCEKDLDSSKFGGRSRVCMVCTYASKKEYYNKYYQQNRERMIQTAKELYTLDHPRIQESEKRKPGRKRRLTLKILEEILL